MMQFAVFFSSKKPLTVHLNWLYNIRQMMMNANLVPMDVTNKPHVATQMALTNAIAKQVTTEMVFRCLGKKSVCRNMIK